MPMSNPGVSWDVFHAYRSSVFFRSLYDNHRATGLSFPPTQDVQLLANQYIYKVFQDNSTLPY